MRDRTKSVASLLAMMLALALALPVAAQQPAEKAALDPAKSVSANLTALTGQMVELQLRSGGTVAGKVEAVNDNLLRLSNLAGKEFYDALVRVEAIESIQVRARGK